MAEFNVARGSNENRREERRKVSLESISADVRYGLRTLRKNSGFAAVAILTLALGIGANVAMFSGVNAVLLRPLPYAQPERPEHIDGLLAQANFFSVLGSMPLLGRTFAAGEDQAGHNHVAVLSYGLWQRRVRGGSR